jgi:hypothetical protein
VEVAWRCDTLGRVLRELGELAGARVQYERAVTIGEATFGPDHPTWPSTADLAAVAAERGEPAEGL